MIRAVPSTSDKHTRGTHNRVFVGIRFKELYYDAAKDSRVAVVLASRTCEGHALEKRLEIKKKLTERAIKIK